MYGDAGEDEVLTSVDSDLSGSVLEGLTKGFPSFSRLEKNNSDSSVTENTSDGSVIKSIDNGSFVFGDPTLQTFSRCGALSLSERSVDFNGSLSLIASLDDIVG